MLVLSSAARFFFLGWIINVWSWIDAYQTARRMNDRYTRLVARRARLRAMPPANDHRAGRAHGAAVRSPPRRALLQCMLRGHLESANPRRRNGSRSLRPRGGRRGGCRALEPRAAALVHHWCRCSSARRSRRSPSRAYQWPCRHLPATRVSTSIGVWCWCSPWRISCCSTWWPAMPCCSTRRYCCRNSPLGWLRGLRRGNAGNRRSAPGEVENGFERLDMLARRTARRPRGRNRPAAGPAVRSSGRAQPPSRAHPGQSQGAPRICRA